MASWGRGRRGKEGAVSPAAKARSEEHTSELQSRQYLVCRLLLEKTNTKRRPGSTDSYLHTPRLVSPSSVAFSPSPVARLFRDCAAQTASAVRVCITLSDLHVGLQ